MLNSKELNMKFQDYLNALNQSGLEIIKDAAKKN